MLKLYKISNQYWWVPENRPMLLAVQITSETEYLPAIKEKILDLILAEGLDQARETLTMMLEGAVQGRTPEELVENLLARVDVGEMVREGSPEMANPAPRMEAEAAVEDQADLVLADLMG